MDKLSEFNYPQKPAMAGQYPFGARIRFKKDIECGPTSEHPAYTYARGGDLGYITGHGTREGYWVKWDRWPDSFGCHEDEFDVIDGSERIK